MILEIDTDDLKDDQVDYLGKFLMNVFTKNEGAWLSPRNGMEGIVEGNGWVKYSYCIGNRPGIQIAMKYRVPQRPELEYDHDPAYNFNNKYLCSYAIYQFHFPDGSVLERYKAGGFHWLDNNKKG